MDMDMNKRREIADLVAKAIVTPHARPARFQAIKAEQLDALPPVAWLVPGEIPAAGLAVLYGPSGCGKSFVALDYAFRIAQERAVLYVAAEGAAGYAARKLAWCKSHGHNPGQAYFLPHAVNLLDPAEVDALIQAAEPIRPALIVVGTLARCMIGGDENTSRDMGSFVAACDDLRLATSSTILLVHHTGKSGLSERGSSALRAAADQMLELSADDDVLTLSCGKAKDSRGFEPRCFRLEIVETGRVATDGQPETSCVALPAERVPAGSRVTRTRRTILETLALETFAEAGASSRTLLDITNMRDSTFYRMMSSLMRQGYIQQAKRGDPYYITETGRSALASLSTPNSLSSNS